MRLQGTLTHTLDLAETWLMPGRFEESFNCGGTLFFSLVLEVHLFVGRSFLLQQLLLVEVLVWWSFWRFVFLCHFLCFGLVIWGSALVIGWTLLPGQTAFYFSDAV